MFAALRLNEYSFPDDFFILSRGLNISLFWVTRSWRLKRRAYECVRPSHTTLDLCLAQSHLQLCGKAYVRLFCLFSSSSQHESR